MSGKIFVGRNFGHQTKNSSLFVTFARRKVSSDKSKSVFSWSASEPKRVPSHLDKSCSSCWIKLCRAKLFVGRKFCHFSKNSSLSLDKLSADDRFSNMPVVVKTCKGKWSNKKRLPFWSIWSYQRHFKFVCLNLVDRNTFKAMTQMAKDNQRSQYLSEAWRGLHYWLYYTSYHDWWKFNFFLKNLIPFWKCWPQ